MGIEFIRSSAGGRFTVPERMRESAGVAAVQQLTHCYVINGLHFDKDGDTYVWYEYSKEGEFLSLYSVDGQLVRHHIWGGEGGGTPMTFSDFIDGKAIPDGE